MPNANTFMKDSSAPDGPDAGASAVITGSIVVIIGASSTSPPLFAASAIARAIRGVTACLDAPHHSVVLVYSKKRGFEPCVKELSTNVMAKPPSCSTGFPILIGVLSGRSLKTDARVPV
jgi:hypothetical protein